MGPLILIPAAVVAAAPDFYTNTGDPETAATNVGPLRSALTAVQTIGRNGTLPTAGELQTWRERHPGLTAPSPIVPRVRTSIPPGNGPLGLQGYQQVATRAASNNAKAGACLSGIFAYETGAGTAARPNPAFWNNNVGNIKGNRGSGPVYFLIDRRNSYDFYPSYNTLEDGIARLVRLLSNANYNRRGRVGCLAAMNAGNVRQLCIEMAVGNYAAGYANPERSLLGTIRALVRLGRLDNPGLNLT